MISSRKSLKCIFMCGTSQNLTSPLWLENIAILLLAIFVILIAWRGTYDVLDTCGQEALRCDWMVGGWFWWMSKMILVFKQNYQYWELYLRNHRMIHKCWKVSRWWWVNGGGLWVLLVFDTNDDGLRDGRRDRVKFRDAIASKNGFIILYSGPEKSSRVG